MGRCIPGNQEVKAFLIGPLYWQSSMEEKTISWYGDAWAEIELRHLWRLRARWMQSNTVRFWRMHWRKALKTWTCHKLKRSFRWTMTPNIYPKELISGFKIMKLKSSTGLFNFLTLTPLNICGYMSNDSWTSMRHHPKEYLSYWRGLHQNGQRYPQKLVKAHKKHAKNDWGCF